MKKYIAYYRVSTKGQEKSGLSLEAQANTVYSFIERERTRVGQDVILEAEFKEVESGKNSNRPSLNMAIMTCRRFLAKGQDAVLVIAKLDRLSRSVAFTSTLMESGIKFICCDMPDVDNLTIHIIAAMAQREAELISQRTREALVVFRERNKDGFVDSKGNFRMNNYNNNITNEGRKRSIESKKFNAANDLNNIRAKNFSIVLRQNGLSYAKIAKKLNDSSFKTVNGCNFSAMQVRNLILM